MLVTIWALSVFISMWLIRLKSIEQPEGQGQTLLHHLANIKSDRVRKMDLGVARSRPRPFLFLAPLLFGAAPRGFSAAGDVGVVSWRCHGHVHVWFLS